jgi:hypothetical protein
VEIQDKDGSLYWVAGAGAGAGAEAVVASCRREMAGSGSRARQAPAALLFWVSRHATSKTSGVPVSSQWQYQHLGVDPRRRTRKGVQ